MKITLNRKADASDTDPLLIQYVEGPDNERVKQTIKVALGQTIDVPDDLAFEIMAKYKGFFSYGASDAQRVSPKAAQHAHKGRPEYSDKAGEAG